MEPTSAPTDLADALVALGHDLGLAAVGVAPAEVLEPARSVLATRKERGLAAEMQFTYRNPERSTDPTRSLPARSIVAAALRYGPEPLAPEHGRGRSTGSASSPEAAERPDAARPLSALTGRVARYARRDHYAVLRRHLERLAGELRSLGHRAEVHADDNHLVDRNVAYAAGLGWYGKSTNLLVPGQGSWVVLGSILTDAELTPARELVVDGCGPCRRCIDACPTGAIVAPGIVDARRCIAWLVQGPAPIPEQFRAAVGDRLYGCDDCQEVCPPNSEATPLPSPVQRSDRQDAGGEELADVALEFVLTAGDDELLDRLGRFYIAGRNPDVLRRTALVVLGNTADPADPAARDLLRGYLEDPEPQLRDHARWALAELDRRSVGRGADR